MSSIEDSHITVTGWSANQIDFKSKESIDYMTAISKALIRYNRIEVVLAYIFMTTCQGGSVSFQSFLSVDGTFAKVNLAVSALLSYLDTHEPEEMTLNREAITRAIPLLKNFKGKFLHYRNELAHGIPYKFNANFSNGSTKEFIAIAPDIESPRGTTAAWHPKVTYTVNEVNQISDIYDLIGKHFRQISEILPHRSFPFTRDPPPEIKNPKFKCAFEWT